MRSSIKGAAAILIAATLIQASKAEEVRTESYPSNHWFRTEIRLHRPTGKPMGLLVLVSGDIHAFSKALLPQLLATNGVMTLITAPARAGLLASEPMLEELDSLIGDVLGKFKASEAKVAIGGFSAGGIGAVRYAQFCLQRERKAHTPAAVLVVDSPL